MSQQSFVQKVAKIQKELKAPKNQRNKFGNYNYRNQEDILEAVKPLLAQQDLVMTVSDEIVEIGGRIYVKATATITDGKESISNTAYAREASEQKGMADAQLTGATSSYARKYALNGLYLIDDTKDADTDEYTEATKKTETKKVETKQETKTAAPVETKATPEEKMTATNPENNVNKVPAKKGWGVPKQKTTETKTGDLY